MLKLILPLLLVTSNALAGEKCFVASDTSKMTAVIHDENRETSEKEQIVSASLKVEVGSKMYAGTIATLDIVTSSGLRASSLSGFQREYKVFQVECDGGNMTVQEQSEGERIVKSDGIRADIEGCDGTLDIVTPGTRFDEVLCEAPKSN